MKKNLVFITALCLLLFLFSCQDKNAFVISGTIDNPGSLKKIYLIQQDTAGISVVDSTNLSDQNKFKFKRSTAYPNVFRLRVGGSIFDFIAKNGDNIDFSTNLTDNTHSYTISGSDESEKLKEFNKISNKYGDITNKIVQEYQAKLQAKGNSAEDSLMKIYQPLFLKNFSEGSEAILKFVKENRTSLAGFYAASSLDSIKYESELVAYADNIKGYFKNNPAVQKFIQQEMAIKPVSVGHQAPDFTTGGS